MAAPYVAAAAELAVARTPTLTAPQLRDAVVGTAGLDDLPGAHDVGGMIDASALIAFTATLPVLAAPRAPAKFVPTAASVAPSAAAPAAQPLPATAPPAPARKPGRCARPRCA